MVEEEARQSYCYEQLQVARAGKFGDASRKGMSALEKVTNTI